MVTINGKKTLASESFIIGDGQTATFTVPSSDGDLFCTVKFNKLPAGQSPGVFPTRNANNLTFNFNGFHSSVGSAFKEPVSLFKLQSGNSVYLQFWQTYLEGANVVLFNLLTD